MSETATPSPVSSEPAFRPLVGALSNRWWRLNHLYWVEDKFGKKVRFRPNWAQEQLFRDLWWLNVILKVRQIGVSTFVDLLELDRCLFNSNQTCGIIDKTDDDASASWPKSSSRTNTSTIRMIRTSRRSATRSSARGRSW
jgi:hypothetical protein